MRVNCLEEFGHNFLHFCLVGWGKLRVATMALFHPNLCFSPPSSSISQSKSNSELKASIFCNVPFCRTTRRNHPMFVSAFSNSSVHSTSVSSFNQVKRSPFVFIEKKYIYIYISSFLYDSELGFNSGMVDLVN